MKTWNDYKDYVRAVDSSAGKDIEEIESLSMIVGAIVEKRTELGLSQRKLAEICSATSPPLRNRSKRPNT